MTGKISVVINTFNEEKNIAKVISSVKDFAAEIIVCDMHSDDDTAVIAKKLGAKILLHKRAGFVEPARNFAISKAENEWILIVDADEEISDSLRSKLFDVIDSPGVTNFVEIPRKNIIFNKWMKGAMWWPDYNIRFFKKGTVTWGDKIHRPPNTEGQGLKLPDDERFAITHHHYDSISQFIKRMNRYTDVQAKELKRDGYKFSLSDLITKPADEFLSRFFAHRGFEDGLHGLSLSLLQAFSFLVLYLKLWEKEDFKEREINLSELKEINKKPAADLNYWFKYGNLSKNKVKRILQRIKYKLS